MKKLLQRWIYRAFVRHCDDLHYADFEACGDPRCWLAWQVEWMLMDYLYGEEAQ